jgi:hypothetical protein
MSCGRCRPGRRWRGIEGGTRDAAPAGRSCGGRDARRQARGRGSGAGAPSHQPRAAKPASASRSNRGISCGRRLKNTARASFAARLLHRRVSPNARPPVTAGGRTAIGAAAGPSNDDAATAGPRRPCPRGPPWRPPPFRSRRGAGLARRVPPAWPALHATRSRPGPHRTQ